jgi:Fur family iron response transcriptional regulator
LPAHLAKARPALRKKAAGLKIPRSRLYIAREGDGMPGMEAIASDRGTRWLARAGLRPTRQRVALAALLVGDGCDRHVTAEGLHAAAQDAGEPVSLATVYNTLRAFCSAGLMQEITVDGSRSYFDTRMEDHPHFYWEDTAELTDAPAEELSIARLPEAPAGAEIARVDVVIRLRRR